MSSPILIDTSAWTQTIRRNGNKVVRDRVARLIARWIRCLM